MSLQHISQQELEHIEAYIKGELSDDERNAFDVQRKNDPDFNAKVEEVKTVLMGIETQALKEKLNDFHSDITTPNTQPKPTKVKPVHWKKLAIAAVFVIAAGSIWFLNQNTNQKLYNDFFVPDPGLPTVMGNDTDKTYDFYRGMVDYKQKNYTAAIAQWQPLLETKPENDTLNYFLGVAHLANENEAEAIPYLKETTALDKSNFIDDAHFYLGLAHLKAGNRDAAAENLKKSGTKNSKDLLKELEQ